MIKTEAHKYSLSKRLYRLCCIRVIGCYRRLNRKAAVYTSADKKDIHLYNGLVKRTFRLSPNVVCMDYKNMITGQQLLRALEPEAIVTINGKEYNVGGLYGQKEKAYLLPEWVDEFFQRRK